jgi:hypothetical protein
VRVLVFREVDDLDELAAAVRVPNDEPMLREPGERRFGPFVCTPWVDLEMDAARAIL